MRPLTYSNTSHVIVYRIGEAAQKGATPIQIHLMLLFIASFADPSLILMYSNTSHVIVYPGRPREAHDPDLIQIHLMLLFIHFGGGIL